MSDSTRATTAAEVAEGAIGAMGMLLALLTPMLRAYRSHWGLSADAMTRALPGDELIDAAWSWTHGIEIDAPVAEVWPWIAQIGQERGGFYSYEALENLMGCAVDNADRLHPEWQDVAVGGSLHLHPQMPMRVVSVEPGRWFVVSGAPEVQASWLFFLEPLGDGHTRLISRFRVRPGATTGERIGLGAGLMEPIGFVMDRRMLLGVKDRVERPKD